MKIVILGGVAAGTKIAAKLMRENRNYEVFILNKGAEISYAGCGLPYYVGHVIEEKSSLIVHTPEKYTALTGAHVLTGVEATKVDRARKEVTAVHLDTQETAVYPYDKLVIATGASSYHHSPFDIAYGNQIPQRDGVFRGAHKKHIF